jgi:hypothetical protein
MIQEGMPGTPYSGGIFPGTRYGGYPVTPLQPPATSKERKALLQKLDTIRLESVLFDGLPLREVIGALQQEVRRRDPEKRGINFLVNPNQPPAPPAPDVPVAAPIDPATGLPAVLPVVAAEPVDINEIGIRIVPALNDVRLTDVLDAIVKVAEIPIMYSVTDYAVVFSLRGKDTLSLGTGVEF